MKFFLQLCMYVNYGDAKRHNFSPPLLGSAHNSKWGQNVDITFCIFVCNAMQQRLKNLMIVRLFTSIKNINDTRPSVVYKVA